MNYPKILTWSVIVALGGFLFGFDVAVISGAEQAIQKQWSLTDLMVGQMVAMGLYGTIAGAALGAWPAERWGRKPALIVMAVLFLICSAGCAMAPDVRWLMFFRFLGGLAVGASSVVAPIYIAEIAPAERRGRLTALFQFNIVAGILVAYLSNYLLNTGGDESWRVMLGAMVVPSLVFLVGVFFVPESPRWLIGARGRVAEGRKILQKIYPENLESALAEITRPTEKTTTAGLGDFFSGRFNWPILLAFLFAAFNQLSGINTVIYYAPRILEGAGLDESASLLSTAGIGLVNLIFTMAGLALIDRYGRRFLMYIGSVGYIVSLGLVAFAFSALSPFINVISKSSELAKAAEKVEKAVESDKIASISAFETAKTALAAAAADPRAGVAAIQIAPGATTSEAKEIAQNARKSAASAIGASGKGWLSSMVVVCLFLFIAAHAIGQGAVIWVFISEIFPNHVRALGNSVGSSTHWVFAALIGGLFPYFNSRFGGASIFGFFAVMMVFQLLFVWKMMPETKGATLEELEKQLKK